MAGSSRAAPSGRRHSALGRVRTNIAAVSARPDADQPGLESRFTDFIQNLIDRDYAFCRLNHERPSFGKGRVYLRYDLLPDGEDFTIAIRLASLHERLKIPGSFHFPWDLIETSDPLKAAAVSLSRFDRNWVTLGIQCDPISGWLARARFGGDQRRLAEFVRSPAFAEFLEDTLAAWRREGGDGPTLREIRDGAWSRLMDLVRSARDTFGDWQSISGRGSPLSNAFGKAVQEKPLLSTVAAWISSIDFLVSVEFELQQLGFGCEATRFPSDDRPGASVFFCGDEKSRLQKALRIRLADGDGFLAIFPVRYWSTDRYADLISDCGAERSTPGTGPGPRAAGADTGAPKISNGSTPLRAHEVPNERPQDGTPENQAGGISRARAASLSSPGLSAQQIPESPVLTNTADLAVLGPRCEWLNTKELCAAARQKLGPGIDTSFPRFVEWLSSEGYSFGGFENGQPRFDERWAYLRYDVHGQDLLAAYVLAGLHERLGIVGSFQINWKHTKAEEAIEPYFLKLMEFDRRYVQFGLHAAPTATWYLEEKLGGDLARQRDAVFTEDFVAWLLDLLSAYNRDGEEAAGLREIREGTDDALSRIADTFRRAFGEWKTISGHGNYLTAGFVRARQTHPELRPLEPYFFPVEYMRKFGVKRFGFDFEVTAFGSDRSSFPRLMTEGASEAVRRRWYRGRVGEGLGFVALLHPATWTCRHNATFFMPAPVPSAAR